MLASAFNLRHLGRKAGADVNPRNEALLEAALQGHTECVKSLLAEGADVNYCDVFISTALSIASERNHVGCARALLAAGADVNKKDCHSHIALYYAAYHHNCDIIQLLLSAGSDINSKYLGESALLAAMKSPGNKRERPSYVNTLNMLINVGADVNDISSYGVTALTYVAVRGYVKCMKLLLEAAADVNLMDEDGNTMLIKASCGGHYKCVNELLKSGADVNSGKSKQGDTALILASQFGYEKCIQQLLKAGADVNVSNNDGANALHIYYQYNPFYVGNLTRCIKRLLRAGIHINMFSRIRGYKCSGDNFVKQAKFQRSCRNAPVCSGRDTRGPLMWMTYRKSYSLKKKNSN